jgi:hypothetical protein
VRRTLPGIDLALGSAVNRVRDLYARCPEPRPDLAGEAWHDLDAALDAACGSGDRDRALSAIRRWEERTTAILRRLVGEGEAADRATKGVAR